jgi:hypothetical protein
VERQNRQRCSPRYCPSCQLNRELHLIYTTACAGSERAVSSMLFQTEQLPCLERHPAFCILLTVPRLIHQLCSSIHISCFILHASCFMRGICNEPVPSSSTSFCNPDCHGTRLSLSPLPSLFSHSKLHNHPSAHFSSSVRGTW